jgi:pimeloyl-ACP methyl ester carboxylesterase
MILPGRTSLLALLLLIQAATLQAQAFKPPKVILPSEEKLQELTTKSNVVGKMIAALQRQGVRDPAILDLEVYHEAVKKILQHQEFFHADSAGWTLEAIQRGMLRGRFLATGELPWTLATGFPVIRGYRSRIDGTVQPYAVTLPATYGKEPDRKWRVDVVLHGRDTSLTEVKFLHRFNGEQAAPKDQAFVQIDIYGRGNNAYRWAGEADVFEAIDALFQSERVMGRERLLDPGRIVLRGFSMGGAGTWHLGLHWPDRWCVIGPGAGFTDTHRYLPKLQNPLPYPQEECLRIYDAIGYAANAFNVPIVAYSGAKDAQKLAADNIEERLKSLGLPMIHLVAPEVEHAFPPAWQAKAQAHYAGHVKEGRPSYPSKIRFVTYTLKYPTCHWVEILGLDRHYEKATVDVERTESGFNLKTANVRVLHLTLPEGSATAQAVAIDGQQLSARPWLNQAGTYHLYLARKAGQWSAVLPQRLITERAQRPQKINGLTGPIDDAFTDAFLCVKGTGNAWHDQTQQFAKANLERFEAEWAKFFRGQLPVKDDIDLTNEDISSKHLILFGDPSSNALIGQVLDGLPLDWTKDRIVFADKKYAAEEHVPVLIYPNPLNASRYVVLNSGHTFRGADLQGTNALLYPRLGDYAILRLAPTESDPLAVNVVTSGLFSDFWRLEKK